jgi:hypothetical protein
VLYVRSSWAAAALAIPGRFECDHGLTFVSLSLSLSLFRKTVELGMLIRQTFESVVMTALYPRSQIDIYVQVLQSDGGSFMPLRPHEFIHCIVRS